MRNYPSVVALVVFIATLLFASPAEAQSSQTTLAHKQALRLIEGKLVFACRSAEGLAEMLELAQARKLEEAQKRFTEISEAEDAKGPHCLFTNIGKVRKLEVVKRYYGIYYDYRRKLDAVVIKATYSKNIVRYFMLDKVRDSAISI